MTKLIATAGLGLLVLAGCGGNDEHGTTPTTPPATPQPTTLAFNDYFKTVYGEPLANTAAAIDVEAVPFTFNNDQEGTFDSLITSP